MGEDTRLKCRIKCGMRGESPAGFEDARTWTWHHLAANIEDLSRRGGAVKATSSWMRHYSPAILVE